MAQRRFGPTLGAGVVIIEKQAAQLIDPAPLGVTLFVTPVEKGNPAKLISTFSKTDFYKKCGNRFTGFTGPDCANDFWDHSNGAGELHVVRVAVQSQLRPAIIDLYSREMAGANGAVAAGNAKSRPVIRCLAQSGGRWGGRRRIIHGNVGSIGANVTNTTITTAKTMLQDEWVSGVLILDGVAGKQYAIVGNTISGVISVSSDSTMVTDLGVSTNTGYTLLLNTNVDVNGLRRGIAILAGDGDTNPTTEFSLTVYVDDSKIIRYPDLNMDPTSPNYFANIINGDQGNINLTVQDLLSPANPAPPDRRPANHSGIISAISPTVLTFLPFQLRQTNGVSNPTAAISGDTDNMQYPDTLLFTVTTVALGNATISCVSKRLNQSVTANAPVSAANTAATNFVFNAMTVPWLPNVTLTCGSTIFTVGDTFELDYLPLSPNALVNGTLTPDLINVPFSRFRIVANTHNTITVQSGDLTVLGGGAAGDRWMVFTQQRNNWVDLENLATPCNGYDALAALSDNDFTSVQLDPSASPARALLVQDKGLVKVACPGSTSTAVQKQLLTFVEALNWQARIQIPDTVLTEQDAVNFINTTIGRDDFGVTHWPSSADVQDPEKPGQLKRTPMTGMILGREALVAKQFLGYHKAAAGIDVTLPKVVQTPLLDYVINEEITNPQGINVIKKVKGNFIVWGDRTISLDPSWKFKHQREQMSHYERQLSEGFDFIIFALNNKNTWANLLVTLNAFFLPEFVKGALSGDKYSDAATIKIDSENNTAQTAADGDLNADITLSLANTVERFNISIGKQGIFDNVST